MVERLLCFLWTWIACNCGGEIKLPSLSGYNLKVAAYKLKLRKRCRRCSRIITLNTEVNLLQNRDGPFWQFLISIIDRFKKYIHRVLGGWGVGFVRTRESPHHGALSTTHETWTSRGFTIDFTSYKIFIIMQCL